MTVRCYINGNNNLGNRVFVEGSVGGTREQIDGASGAWGFDYTSGTYTVTAEAYTSSGSSVSFIDVSDRLLFIQRLRR